MNNVIIPEISPDVEALKAALAEQLPAGCKIRIPPLNRKSLRVIKAFGIVTEVILRRDKIVVHNSMPMYAGLATFIFPPFGIYLICKMKDGETLRSTVHDIVACAAKKP